MNKNIKPIIAISAGDLNGIGAEIILKSIKRADILSICTPLIFIPSKVFNYVNKHLGLTTNYNLISDLNKIQQNKVNIFDINSSDFTIEWGKSTNKAGEIAFKSLEYATKSVSEGKADLLVTAPINKDNIQSKDFNFPGHTEYLAKEWKGDSLMFMVHSQLKVALVTQHIPIQQVSSNINQDIILKKINQLRNSLINDFNIHEPIIAVTGLNPHSGDNGLLGTEEREIIIPALKKSIEDGAKVFGPFPADSFYNDSNISKYDAVLSMYHDQGLIPFKTVTGLEGVNFTAGLTHIRTSPDHGVGYDIAGKGIADETSMVEAIYKGIEIWENRRENKELKENQLKVSEHKFDYKKSKSHKK